MSTLFNPSPPPYLQSAQSLFGGEAEPSTRPVHVDEPADQGSSLLRTSSPLASPSPHSSEDPDDFITHEGSNRPRWNGSVKKWQRYTQNERQLAQSLEHLEAQDLSVHLFDAFSLSRRNYAKVYHDNVRKRGRSRLRKQQPKSYHRKEKWLRSGAWAPGTKWTAWPLSLEDVPGEDDTFTKDLFNESAKAENAYGDQNRVEKPSRWIGDVIVSEVLRKSRERCYNQGLGPGDEDVLSKVEETEMYTEGMDTDTEAKSGDHLDRKPVIMADDEKAAQILQPTVDHVLHKLDDLFMGLHHSRKNQLDFDSSDTGTDSQASRESSRIGRSRSRSVPRKERSLLKRRKGEDGEPRYSQKYLIPRDWSEVLGIATMVGWDPEVVHRASVRCSDLFGEHMTFRTMHEAPGEGKKNQTQIPRAFTTGHTVSRSRSRIGSVYSEDPTTSWVCPEESCPRHTKPFNARWRVHDHVKRTHGYVYQALASQPQSDNDYYDEDDDDDIQPMQDITVLDDSLCCPILNCKRHEKPYPSRWRLNEHMKKRHGLKKSKSVAQTSESEVTKDASGGEDTSQTDLLTDEMVGGVHVNGFMKPIKGRKGWAELGKERERHR